MFKKLLLILFFISFVSFSSRSEPAETYIAIDIIARKLYLLQNEQIIKTYPIGVGRSKQFMTPPGLYKVEVKDDNPGWLNPFNPKVKIPPGPHNPLGTRWIGFHSEGNKAVYGMHGTNQPSSVGKFVSHGCIRMLIPDSEDLFKRVEIGTKVLVVYNRFELIEREGDLILTVHEDPYGIAPLTVENLQKLIEKKYPNAVLNLSTLQDIANNNILEQARLVGYLED